MGRWRWWRRHRRWMVELGWGYCHGRPHDMVSQSEHLMSLEMVLELVT